MSNVITTYLQDHHAGSAAGVDVFRRVAEGHGDPEVREQVERLVPEIARDQKSLEDIMSMVGEKLARLKPNERIKERSPLSDIEELEGLVAAVHAKGLGWRLLLEVPDERLDKDLLQNLYERAQEQEKTLESLRLGKAKKRTGS